MTNLNGTLPNPFPGHVQATVAVAVTATKETPKYKFKKAGTNGNIIAVVLDESGSMTSCWDQTIDGFNEFVQGQRNAENAGDAKLTLNKFDAPKIETVFADRPLAEVPALDKTNYRPNGGTNLLDCIGYTIEQVNDSLAKLKKKERPGVIITIMTDGAENASRSFTNQQIKDMVKAAEDADWTFTFLGANIDSFAVGSTFGMSVQNSVNYSTTNMGATMAAVSASTTRMRSAKLAGSTTADIYASGLYTDDEKKNMTK